MKVHSGGAATSGTRTKVTLTLGPVRVATPTARQVSAGISRSEVIDEMIAGYKALAGKNLALAEEGMESLWE